MEHEVFVPVPAETLRQLLRDPARVARCVPGLQQDADASAGPLSGRLKVRAGGHTITYRGALHLTEQDGVFAVEGKGTEVRGGGSVKVTLAIRPEPTDGGTTLGFTGTSHAEGRLADLSPDTATSAAHRLLDRFAAAMAAAVATTDTGTAGAGQAGPEAAAHDATDTGAASEAGAADTTSGGDSDADTPSGAAPDEAVAADSAVTGSGDDADTSVFDTPVPPPSLGPDAEDEFDDVDDLDEVDDVDELTAAAAPEEPAAEAAHARRTMIGRSAEEVDHAPPRGRYAPAPAPEAGTAGVTLRWLAPAAALAVASAVVIGRVLRRRQ
ncbi:SRPBCC domain-containing protein [Streptomyces sp. NPDC006208]|uniref:SRPBCC domain-containing protein n=1 Tax=Streptomyces sp. NPDC006208 TaxID=3156734 RepID=UPI0033A44ACC